ncbi:MAG: helix-turn-helix domain-containing protein [Pseudonocardiaceae bacterium]
MPGITTSRIILGARLEKFRLAAGVTRKAAAAAAGCSVAHIGHIETGRNAPTGDDELCTLASLYAVDDAAIAELLRLWVDASKPGWWKIYGLAPDYARYVGLETDAQRLISLELENIHGLLQTERYMRYRYHLEWPQLSARDVDKRVLTRLNRQHRVAGGDDPLQLAAVVSAAALLRCAYTPSVAQGQLHQLAQRAALPNVELRVLPLEVGLHSGQDGSFSVLSFRDQLLPDVVYQEGSTGGHQTDVQTVAQRLHTRFDELRDQTLGPNESLAWITQLANPTR